MDYSEELADVIVEVETQYKCEVCRRNYKTEGVKTAYKTETFGVTEFRM